MMEIRHAYRILVRKLERKRLLGDLKVNGKVILKLISKIMCEVVDWFYLVKDMVQWHALVNIEIYVL
jgi:hypothetical protein